VVGGAYHHVLAPSVQSQLSMKGTSSDPRMRVLWLVQHGLHFGNNVGVHHSHVRPDMSPIRQAKAMEITNAVVICNVK
jgi:hypothetical protein